MRGEQSPNGLLYAGEHLSCKNYMTDISTGFKYILKSATIIQYTIKGRFMSR